jgi:pimeloyl-ACP methyl ester carboxylesterase
MRRCRTPLGEPFGDLHLGWCEWGSPHAARIVVCVHGLTRNARDFDMLAGALAGAGARVIAVDVAGRGTSDWLDDPGDYRLEAYVAQLRRLLERLEIEAADWIGTSMGGLIGILLAAEEPTPIARLVLNDIGALVPGPAMAPIGAYLGLDLRFGSVGELEGHLRLIHAGFGPLGDAQWRHLAEHSARQDGPSLRLHYDPAIRVPFLDDSAEDIDLWAAYDRVRCPVLLLRGSESALLPPEIAAAMTSRGPKAELTVFEGIGHAPALMAEDQIAVIREWLGL